MLEASRHGVPVIPIGLTALTWDEGVVRDYVTHMEERMGVANPAGLELLLEHTEHDLSELKAACLQVLDDFASQVASNELLEWNPHIGDNAMLAKLQVRRRRRVIFARAFSLRSLDTLMLYPTRHFKALLCVLSRPLAESRGADGRSHGADSRLASTIRR